MWCFCFTVDTLFSFVRKYFMLRGSILISKLLSRGYFSRKLHTTFSTFYGCHTNLVHTSVSHMLKGFVHLL